MKNTRDLYLEISSAATIITGIGNQFDGANTRLTDESLRLAFYGVSNYLERIAEGVEALESGEDSIVHNQEENPVVEPQDQETFNPQKIEVRRAWGR